MRSPLIILATIAWLLPSPPMMSALHAAGSQPNASCCCCEEGQPCTCSCGATGRNNQAPAQIQCRCDEQPVTVLEPIRLPTARPREFERPFAAAASIASDLYLVAVVDTRVYDAPDPPAFAHLLTVVILI